VARPVWHALRSRCAGAKSLATRRDVTLAHATTRPRMISILTMLSSGTAAASRRGAQGRATAGQVAEPRHARHCFRHRWSEHPARATLEKANLSPLIPFALCESVVARCGTAVIRSRDIPELTPHWARNHKGVGVAPSINPFAVRLGTTNSAGRMMGLPLLAEIALLTTCPRHPW
jgi:hypothetical protein